MAQENLFNEAKSFFQVFEPKGEMILGVKVPGCVQLIGEVTAFNSGRIIAANTDKSVLMLAQKRKERDRSVHFYSRKYDEKIRMSLNESQLKNEDGWANYMSSTLFFLEGSNKKVSGMNVFIDNKIPDQFNANNMEAMEVGIAVIAQKYSDWNLEPAGIAEACAEGEKKFMSKESSFVKYMPMITEKKGAVTFFDTATNRNENLQMDMKDYVFMIISSGLKKRTTDERKNRIIQEVKESIEIMKKNGANIDGLHNLTMEDFDEYRSHLTITQRKRCAYFISENDRVESAREALKANDMQAFIAVINDAQKNIKNRLEIVVEENELLVDTALDMPEIKAVRLMDMGVDGTIFAIVERPKVQQVETRIKKVFLTRTGLELYIEKFELTNEMEEVSINVEEFRK